MSITKKQLLVISIYLFSILTLFNIQTIHSNTLDDNSQTSFIDREELNLTSEILNENSKILTENEDWKRGKSIRVDQNLQTDFLDHDETHYSLSTGDIYFEDSRINSHVNDGLFYNITLIDEDNNKYIKAEAYYSIFTNNKGGYVNSERKFNIVWKNGTENTHFSDEVSFYLEGGYSNRGYLNIYAVFEMTDEENSLSTYYLRNGIPTLINYETNSYPKEEFDQVRIYIDLISFIQTEKTVNLRSNYRYVSDTLIEYCITDLFNELGETRYYYTPLSWNYSSSFPECNVIYNTTLEAWQVTKSCYTGTIDLYFFEGSGYGVDYDRHNQFLAITETTSDYLIDIGFETGSYTNDWQLGTPSYPFDEITINTSIVSSGAFSLRFYAQSS